MADNASVIREYLVSLGFKLDQSSLAKWDSALAKTAKQVTAFATTMVGIATTTTLFVSHMADEFADLYWASVKVRDTVANVKDFQLAFTKVGGNAESALAALEAMADALRFNPAAETVLGNIGVQTRDANGGLRKTKDILLDLANAPIPEWLKADRAAYFGITTDQLRELEQIVPGVDDAINKMFSDLGVNADEASKRMLLFKNQMEEFKAKIDAVGLALADNLLPYAQGFLDIANGLIRALVWLNKWTGGLSTQALFLALAFGGLVWALGLIPAVIGIIIIALIGLYEQWDRVVDLMVGGWDRVKAAWSAGIEWLRQKYNIAAKYLHMPQWEASPTPKPANDNKPAAKAKPGIPDYQQQQKNIGAWDIVPPPTTSVDGVSAAPNGRTPLGVRSNNPGNLMPGGHEAQYGDIRQGMSAMANLLVRYSNKGLDTVGKIISKYAPPNENNTAAYIKQVAQGLGVGANDHLNLNDSGVLANLMSLMIKHEQGYSPYSKSLIEQAAKNATGLDGKRLAGHGGGNVVHITQKTDIKVSGSDAAGTGRAVAREQGRVNGDMVRNFAGAQN